jgi:hypothetical protein
MWNTWEKKSLEKLLVQKSWKLCEKSYFERKIQGLNLNDNNSYLVNKANICVELIRTGQ